MTTRAFYKVDGYNRVDTIFIATGEPEPGLVSGLRLIIKGLRRGVIEPLTVESCTHELERLEDRWQEVSCD